MPNSEPDSNSPEDLTGFGEDIYLGLVRAIGTDLSDAIEALRICFRRAGYGQSAFHVIKLSGFFGELISSAAGDANAELAIELSEDEDGRFEYYRTRMNAGDWLRETLSGDILAQRAIVKVRALRPAAQAQTGRNGAIYVFDSLMHPSEVTLMRSIYGRRFFVIAVHSTAEHRAQRLFDELRSSEPAGPQPIDGAPLKEDEENEREADIALKAKTECERKVETLMSRDEGLSEPISAETPASPGRRVAIRKTFADADLFVTLIEATAARSSKRLGVIERFVEKLFDEPFHTPTRVELGMAHAYVAGRRSAALSRTVGAAICTPDGDLLAVGVNDVPAPGGGHYWPEYDGSEEDFRDHRFEWTLPSGKTVTGVDPNDQIKIEIFRDLMTKALSSVNYDFMRDGDQSSFFGQMKRDPDALIRQMLTNDEVRDSQFFDVIEYSRTVHAEMSALLSCARHGISTQGAILFCTTFPCHECSRHIIGAGISLVVYVEPYAKSRVASLHSDAVVVERFTGSAPLATGTRVKAVDPNAKVRFEPFIGIAPNRQQQLYSSSKRKIDGQVGDFESLGQTRHWELGPNSQVRASVSSPQPATRVAEQLMVFTSEEYIEMSLARRGLIETSIDKAGAKPDNMGNGGIRTNR